MFQSWPRIDEEYFELLKFAETLDCQIPSESSQNNILKLLVKTFRAESGQFCMHDDHHAEARKEKTALVNLSWNYTDQYIAYYHNIDPFIHIMPDVGAFRNQDLMPSGLWRNNEFNSDFIRPQRIQNLLVMRLLDSERMIGHIGLFRHYTSPPFSQKDLYKAQHLAAVFSQKIKQKELLQKSRELELLLRQLQDIPSTGVMVLDSDLGTVYSNLKMLEFEHLLGAYGNIGGQPGHFSSLPEQVKSECRLMSENMRISNQPLLQNRHVVLYQSQHQKVDVEIMTLPLEMSSTSRFNPFYLLLIFSKSVNSPSRSLAKITADTVLTAREKEIAVCLCKGMTNKEISQKLFISLPTVATHVQHVLRKTGISRRSQFISKLLS